MVLIRNTTYVFTDGGARGNTIDLQDGAWGVLVSRNGEIEEANGLVVDATNNMAEIEAAIQGLSRLKEEDSSVALITDSAYVCNCINDKWYIGWEQNGWRNSKGKPVENKEFWEKLLLIYRQRLSEGRNISFFHINSHIPDSKLKATHRKFCKRNGEVPYELFLSFVEGNEKVDDLATAAMDGEIISKNDNTDEIEKEPRVICVLGEGGSGKSTIVDYLLENYSHRYDTRLEYTSRPIRQEEVDGVDYHFITVDDFYAQDSSWASRFYLPNNNWIYGYKKEQLNNLDRDTLLVVNPTAYRYVKSYCIENDIDMLSIYLKLSWRERAKRMVDRGDGQLEIGRRLVHDEGHFMGIKDSVDFVVDLDSVGFESAKELAEFIDKEI